MNLFQNWKNLIGKIENMSSKDVNAWFSLFMIFIVIDLFGIYWYLQMKQLGGAILIVLIFFLAFLMFFSKKKSTPKSKEIEGGKKEMPEEPTEEKPQEEESTGDFFDMSEMGLPDSGETQKRLDKALGTMDF